MNIGVNLAVCACNKCSLTNYTVFTRVVGMFMSIAGVVFYDYRIKLGNYLFIII